MGKLGKGLYKWVLLTLLSSAFFLCQADRALFGLLTIPIQKELGLTDVEIVFVVLGAACLVGAAPMSLSFFRYFTRYRVSLS